LEFTLFTARPASRLARSAIGLVNPGWRIIGLARRESRSTAHSTAAVAACSSRSPDSSVCSACRRKRYRTWVRRARQAYAAPCSSYDSQRTKVARRVKLAHNRPRPSNAARDASRIAAGIDDHVWGLETIVGLLDHAVADTHAASLKVCGHD